MTSQLDWLLADPSFNCLLVFIPLNSSSTVPGNINLEINSKTRYPHITHISCYLNCYWNGLLVPTATVRNSALLGLEATSFQISGVSMLIYIRGAVWRSVVIPWALAWDCHYNSMSSSRSSQKQYRLCQLPHHTAYRATRYVTNRLLLPLTLVGFV